MISLKDFIQTLKKEISHDPDLELTSDIECNLSLRLAKGSTICVVNPEEETNTKMTRVKFSIGKRARFE